MFLPSCLLALVAATLAAAEADPIADLVNKANAYLTSGHFNNAIGTFSEAIEMSPADYLLYYKRATAYYSLNRHQSALDDFNKVLDLTGQSFDAALLMKGRIQAREGEWSEARSTLTRYAKVPGDADAGALLRDVTDGEVAARAASQALSSAHFDACVEAASNALAVAPYSISLRSIRADCLLATGEPARAVGDLTRLAQTAPASTTRFARLARLAYFLLGSEAVPQAQAALKQCLHFDPDARECAQLHRRVKAFEKSFKRLQDLRERADWRGMIGLLFGTGKVENVMGSGLAAEFEEELAKLEMPAAGSHPYQPQKISERRREIVHDLCKAYWKSEQPRKGEWWCEETLRFKDNESDLDGLIGRGEAALVKEQWEEAVRVFERAFEASGRTSQEIAQRLQKAQRLLKQSRRKDYYKVLGVSRDADERTIKKAYRRKAKDAHPDKGGSEEQMATLNEAYEVLSDPELRQRFDNGDDPNDPSSQAGGPFQQGAGGGAHPFAQFFQQAAAGGGGGSFFQHSGGMPFQFQYSSGGRHH